MTNEDLSAGFQNLHDQPQRDAAWAQSIAESVHWNAQLMDSVIERVNVMEAAAKVAAATVDSLTPDVRKAVDMTHGESVKLDLHSTLCKGSMAHGIKS